MSDDHTYNGHTNYETWSAALHLDNDSSTYNLMLDRAAELLDENDGDVESAVIDMADWLKEFVEEVMCADANQAIENGGLAAQLLNSALSEIDYYSLAESYLNEAKENQ